MRAPLVILAVVASSLAIPSSAYADTDSGVIAYVSQVTSSGAQSLEEMDLSHGSTTTLLAATTGSYYSGLAVSPDGTKLAYTQYTSSSSARSLEVMDLKTKTVTTSNQEGAQDPHWLANGDLIANVLTSGTPTPVELDPTAVAQPVILSDLSGVTVAAVSPDGELVAGEVLVGATQAYELFDRTSGHRFPLSSKVRRLDGRQAVLSPTLTRYSYATEVGDGLGRNPVDVGLPHSNSSADGDVNPDGTLAVAAIANGSAYGHLYVAATDGSGERPLTSSDEASESNPVFVAATNGLAPAAPVLGTVTAVGGPRSGVLTWPDLDGAAVGTRVLWKEGSTPPVSASDADVVAETAVVSTSSTTLTPGTWSWSVSAFDGYGGTSTPQTGTVTVALAPPLAPTGVQAFSKDSYHDTITVAWSPSKATTGGPVTSYTVTRSPGGATAVQKASAKTYRVVYTKLGDDVKYTFTVRASNADGISAASPKTTPVATRPHLLALSTGIFHIAEGGTAVITGRLIHLSDHRPAAGQKLTLYVDNGLGDGSRLVRSVTKVTDAHGEVHLRVKPLNYTDYVWRFSTTAKYVNDPGPPNNYTRSTVFVTSGMTLMGPTSTNDYTDVGRRTTLHGSTSRSQHGRVANIQRYGSQGWVTVGHVTVSSNGTYSYTFTVQSGGIYRICLPASGSHPFSSSDYMYVETGF